MSEYNKYDKTARWVSAFGKKETLRNDPFASAATFTITDDGFDYRVSAHSSPYSSHGQSFTLTVKKDGKTVCQYSYPKNVAKVSIGKYWFREE